MISKVNNKMKLKVKSGKHLLSISDETGTVVCHNQHLYITFIDNCVYISFRQKQNRVLIETTGGRVELVFTGVVHSLEYDSFCKDQLVLKAIYGQ